jgi:hypothetical protein
MHGSDVYMPQPRCGLASAVELDLPERARWVFMCNAGVPGWRWDTAHLSKFCVWYSFSATSRFRSTPGHGWRLGESSGWVVWPPLVMETCRPPSSRYSLETHIVWLVGLHLLLVLFSCCLNVEVFSALVVKYSGVPWATLVVSSQWRSPVSDSWSVTCLRCEDGVLGPVRKPCTTKDYATMTTTFFTTVLLLGGILWRPCLQTSALCVALVRALGSRWQQLRCEWGMPIWNLSMSSPSKRRCGPPGLIQAVSLLVLSICTLVFFDALVTCCR